MKSRQKTSYLGPPNLLGYLRIAGSGFLVWLAARGLEIPFLVAFTVLWLTDWLDGRLARSMGYRSGFGAKLDALADKVVYAAVAVSAYWLAPDAALAELPFVAVAVASWLVAAGYSLAKFRTLPAYHTKASKAGWALVGLGVILFYADWTPWAFRISMIVVTLANAEIVAITRYLSRPRTDVPGLHDALWLRRMQGEGEPVTVNRRRIDAGDGGPLRILHVSDLHFGWPYVPEVGEALVRAAADLRPHVIVVSGDLTQRARREQFQEAKDLLARLPDVPKIVVPGNHDVPLYRFRERLFHPRRLYREMISDDLDTAWEVPGAIFVAIDSTSPRRAISNGRIHLRQLDFVRRALKDVPPETAKIVVAHHHFAPAPDFERDQTMPKARRALDLFAQLRVDMILGGHLHRGYIGNSLDVYPGEDRAHGIIIVQCGTTTSRRGRAREREKNSLNLIELGEETVRITHHMYFSELDGFRPADRYLFPRPSRRYLELPKEPTG